MNKGKVIYTGNQRGVDCEQLKIKLNPDDIIAEGYDVQDDRMFVTHIYVDNKKIAQKVEKILSEEELQYVIEANIIYKTDWGKINIRIDGKKMSPGGIASTISNKCGYRQLVV